MQGLVRLLGHPLHPALVHFPIAFWTAATVLDIGTLLQVYDGATFAWYCLLVGSAAAMPALATGMIEMGKLTESAFKPGSSHMMLMSAAWMSYLVALVTRVNEPGHRPALLSCVCSAAGLALMTVGGWFGAKLVYEHGAGRAESK